jgi:serine/threonine-protein kinase
MDETHPDTPALATPTGPELPHELRSLGGHRILRRLGEGATGTVYLAYHDGKDLQVALKVFNDTLVSTQQYLDRFYREGRLGAALDHPNLVRLHSIGQDQATSRHYMVLEYVDGPSARALLDTYGKLSIGDALHIILGIARALEYAHSRNVVHRDIKPDNILTTGAGVAKLADLSLARRTDELSHLTAARMGFGTTHYMPYEQAINARRADGRSDIYALGATLYHLITGTVPFPGENHLEVVEKKRLGFFTPAGKLRKDVPELVDRILARMLARTPKERYQTASELIIDLERSGLVPAIPSFADPEKAMSDPWLQACRSNAVPTRLDPETPAPRVPEPPDGVWEVRFRNKAGRLVQLRGRTREVIGRLKTGWLPAATEARRAGEKEYAALLTFEEFRDIEPAPRPRRKSRRSAPDRRKERAEPAAAQVARWRPLLVAASVLAVLLLILLSWLVFLRD